MTTTPTPTLELVVIPLESLIPADDNPRSKAPDPDLVALCRSIQEVGILQPLIVEPHPDEDRSFRIKAGHRRLRAAEMACLTEVPCIVMPGSEAHRQATMFAENVHRKPLSALEQARALKQMADTGMTQREVAESAAVSQGQVSKLISLLKLPEAVHADIESGEMTQETAVTMASLPAAKVKELCEDGVPDEYDVVAAKEDLEEEAERARLVKEAKDKGWAVLDEAPNAMPKTNLEGKTDPALLDTNRQRPYGRLRHVDPKEHESEPCHAVFVRSWDNHVLPACTTPDAHPKPRGWKSPAEIKEAAVKSKPSSSGDSGSPYSPAESKRRKDRVSEAVGPVVTLCRQALDGAGKNVDQVLNLLAVTLLRNDDMQLGVFPEEMAGLLGLESGSEPKARAALVAELEAKKVGGAELLYAMALADGIGVLEELLDRVDLDIDKKGKFDRKARQMWQVSQADGLLTLIGAVVDEVPTLDDIANGLLAAKKAANGGSEVVAEKPRSKPAKKAVKRVPAKKTAPPPKTAEPIEETTPDGPVSHKPPTVTLRQKDGVHVVTCSEHGQLANCDSATEAGKLRDAHVAEHAPGDGAVAEAVTVTPFHKRGKWFLTCSACSQLEGFNTTEAVAEEKASAHVAEKHSELVGASS